MSSPSLVVDNLTSRTRPMFEVFEEVFAGSPAKLALVEGERTLTYAELSRAVNRCATLLAAASEANIVAFRPSSRVEAVVLMLASIKLGRAFVSIELDTTDAACRDMLAPLGLTSWIESVSIESGQLTFNPGGDPRALGRIPFESIQDVLCIMFTSGSTGVPKGVMIRRESVVHLLRNPTFLPVSEEDVFATYASLTFDASTLEIFTPLLNGNTLVVLDKRQVIEPVFLKDAIERHGITILWMTAGLFNNLVLTDRAAGLHQLEHLMVGGDRVNFDAALQFLTRAGAKTALYNGYGPTENTIFSTMAKLDADLLRARRAVPIGKPVEGVQCELFDASGTCIPGAGTGRLFVSGTGLSLGYVGNESLTAASFPAHRAATSGRFYDTGDTVSRDEDGCYYFVGRDDDQVKVNGHRVELGSVEARASATGLTPRALAFHSERLNGLILVCQGDPTLAADAAPLQRALQDTLAYYERPKRIYFTEDWPLTANGKTDRKALARYGESLLAAEARKATTTTESGADVEAIIAGLIGVSTVSSSGRLFDIGFDSVSITHFQAQLQKSFGVELSILDIYQAGTIGRIKEMVRDKLGA